MNNSKLKYLIFVSKIGIPLVLVLIILEFLLQNIPNDYKVKNDFISNKKEALDILYFGNSHTFYGINPIYSKFEGYNLGHISQSPNIDYLLFEKAIKNCSNIKTIILPLDYFSLFERLDKTDEDWRIKNYKIYYQLKIRNQFNDNFELLNVRFIENCKRVFKYYILNKSEVAINDKGYGLSFNSKDNKDLDTTGIQAAKRHFINDKKFFKKNQVDYVKTIELAKKKGIKVILVSFPTYKTYHQKLNKLQLQKTIEFGYYLKLKYNNVQYINLIESVYFEAKDFHDADHLNEIGAKKLTNFLDMFIK